MERVLADMQIQDCDAALELLRGLAVSAGVGADLREVARLSIDDVLDRRNELTLEASRMGAQS